MSSKKFYAYFAILSISLTISILIILLVNEFASILLRNNPELVMAPESRINENTRAIREKMINDNQAVLWYNLDSANEVKPMWDEFYRAGNQFESYVHFRSKSYIGKYYGVELEGYRRVKNNGEWPISVKNFNVFFFGGSTSFGVGPYWATTASYLQESLNAQKIHKPVRVYNFGRSGYQSSQEMILFQQLLSGGHKPDMVVFLDGLNDFCFLDGQPSSWQNLAGFFNESNDRYVRQMAGYGIVTKWELLSDFVKTMPLMKLTNSVLDRTFYTKIPQYNSPQINTITDEKSESKQILESVIKRYLNNMLQIKAISNAYGIVPVIVWQPIPTYQYDLTNHIFNPDRLGCHINSKIGYPLMHDLQAYQVLGDSFIWAADIQKDLKEPIYVDAFHYTAPMSKRIAEFIGETISRRRLIKVVTNE
jgi:lysophospholipase L1-like esterase